MASDGPAFYDDEAVFQTYLQRRSRPDNPNDTMEGPVIQELIGDPTGLRVLDIGCGSAAFGVALLRQGCAAYTGIDGSHAMVATARANLAGTAGVVELATAEAWSYPTAAFDLVVSRLALHYVDAIEPVIQQIAAALAPGGRLICSVEHPVITSSDLAWQSGGRRQHWLVDDYFHEGRRETDWMGGRVVKYHRTIERYITLLLESGLAVTAVREAAPQRAHVADEAEFARRSRIPLFLILRGQRTT